MLMKKTVTTSALLALALLFSGCGEKPNSASETKEKAPDKPPEPVTLKFYTKTPIDDFEKYIKRSFRTSLCKSLRTKKAAKYRI